ncbi:MAG: hypothetical protein LBC92_04120, partial [Rickettsiales bacterium]|nr:hypothetical protein [Rickettsiales bacterium]
KLIPFVYKEQNYTILISTGMLLFFDQYNNKIQNSARPEIRREYLKQLKYSHSITVEFLFNLFALLCLSLSLTILILQ